MKISRIKPECVLKDDHALKGVLIDFKTPFVFVGLHRVYLLADADIYFLESSDQILLIRIVKKTNLIKANQRRLLS